MADIDKIAALLGQTWPARAAKAAWGALQLPGDVYQGNVSMTGADGRTNPEVIGRSAELAGMMALGATAAPRGALGSGFVRPLPRDNYAGPINRYTDDLYRQMRPADALEALPGSPNFQTFSPFGNGRQFYADVPELATGQMGNVGAMLKFDAAPFRGVINTEKPGWQHAWQQGKGEYMAAADDVLLRDVLKSAEIEKSAMREGGRAVEARLGRTLQNMSDMGWKVDDAGGLIRATR